MAISEHEVRQERERWLAAQPRRSVDTGDLDRAVNTDIKLSMFIQEFHEFKSMVIKRLDAIGNKIDSCKEK